MMKQWLFLIQLIRKDFFATGPTPEEIDAVSAHFAYWEDLTNREVALVVGRTQDENPLGLAIFLAQDEASAKATAENDPAVIGGVFSYQVRPYEVALLGSGTGFIHLVDA